MIEEHVLDLGWIHVLSPEMIKRTSSQSAPSGPPIACSRLKTL
jgi:hypothetical protein